MKRIFRPALLAEPGSACWPGRAATDHRRGRGPPDRRRSSRAINVFCARLAAAELTRKSSPGRRAGFRNGRWSAMSTVNLRAALTAGFRHRRSARLGARNDLTEPQHRGSPPFAIAITMTSCATMRRHDIGPGEGIEPGDGFEASFIAKPCRRTLHPAYHPHLPPHAGVGFTARRIGSITWPRGATVGAGHPVGGRQAGGEDRRQERVRFLATAFAFAPGRPLSEAGPHRRD